LRGGNNRFGNIVHGAPSSRRRCEPQLRIRASEMRIALFYGAMHKKALIYPLWA
jgi:hypothetical protein